MNTYIHKKQQLHLTFSHTIFAHHITNVNSKSPDWIINRPAERWTGRLADQLTADTLLTHCWLTDWLTSKMINWLTTRVLKAEVTEWLTDCWLTDSWALTSDWLLLQKQTHTVHFYSVYDTPIQKNWFLPWAELEPTSPWLLVGHAKPRHHQGYHVGNVADWLRAWLLDWQTEGLTD